MALLGRISVVVIVSLTLGFWLNLIAKYYMPTLFLAQVGIFATVVRALLPRLRELNLGMLVFVGGILGFISAIGSAAVAELMVRGVDGFVGRDFTPNVYFYPFFSFAWLHGMIVLPLLVHGIKRGRRIKGGVVD